MNTLYDNKRFIIQQTEAGGLWISNMQTGYTTSATVYDNNTVGYTAPGVMTKDSRRAIDRIVQRQTGRPAMVKVDIWGSMETYAAHFKLDRRVA